MSYSREDVRNIVSMWSRGYSAGEIAKHIGRTRNAVMSRVTAYGAMRNMGQQDIDEIVEYETTKVGRVSRASRARREMRRPIAATIQDASCPEPMNVDLLDIPLRGCKWPTGMAGDAHLFCGHPQSIGSSYCPWHCKLAWRQ